MTALQSRIARLIAAAGPLSVADFMGLCLSDPKHGYYMTRQPFGRDGDFTTAPETSQMFGELIGAWLVAAWRALGSPPQPVIAELGPGRATLMKDVVRTLKKLEPALVAAPLHLIETSPALTVVQRAALAGAGAAFAWHANFDRLPAGPLLLIANELFDALPVRQYVKTGMGWRERSIGIDFAGQLVFMAGAGALDVSLLPPAAEAAAEGAIVELAPARAALMHEIAARIAHDGGAALLIDYGYAEPGLGDTVQAVARHKSEDPLAHPGEADITAHVDFAALMAVATRARLTVRLVSQRDFLLGLGLRARAERLAAGDAARRARLAGEIERLTGTAQMGTLFKVLAVGSAGMTLPGLP